MNRISILLLAALVALGCQATGPSAVPPENQAVAANRPVEPLGGVTFRAISPANTQYLGNLGRSTTPSGTATGDAAAPAPGAQPPAAPQTPTTGGSVTPTKGGAGGSVSGNMYGYYGYGYYFGASSPTGVPMALVSLTEGEAPGSRGPLQAILTNVVAPVLKDWAADAHLTSSNANLGNDGLLAPSKPSPDGAVKPMMPYYGGGNGWQLSYVSPSRNEVLSFQVTPEKTLVVRARWAPLNLAATPVGVDSDAAVQKLVTAIEDRNFKSEEETTGKDYFLGTAFDQAAMNPVSPEVRTEVVYDVPDNARWYASLQPILGKLVWELSFYSYNVMPVPAVAVDGVAVPPVDPGYYFDNSARGMIDAQTGAVIRFSRPTKRYYNYPSATPSIAPKPPIASPSPTASPSPSPSASPSPN